MKRVIFFHSQTLHAKVTIPLALELVKLGFEVFYLKNRPDFFRFSLKNIIDNPISVNFLNRRALRYVAKQINYLEEFDKWSDRFRTTFSRNFGRYDAVISTTKDLPELKELSRRLDVAVFALGYQHIPFFAMVGKKFQTGANGCNDSIFFKDNAFTRDHGFLELFDENSGVILNNFTYLDRVYTHSKNTEISGEDNFVLIFHPGGYRRVLTEPGASHKISYEKQRDFMIKVCLPLLEAGLKPVIKVHPLHARYHGLADLKAIAEDIEGAYGLGSDTIGITDAWFWSRAFKASFILTFGSSSIYELWAAGVKNVYVGNFLGQERSKRFNYFPSICLNTYKEYVDLIKSKRFKKPVFDEFTMQVINAYAGLFDGDAASKAANLISSELS